MAILQISRIQNRRGLKENLPQLSGAELGWAVDTRELYIGNGNVTISPQPGLNTRILTEFDLLGQAIFIGNVTLLAGAVSNVALVIEPNLNSIIINYSIVGSTDKRAGSMKISTKVDGSSISYEDDYVETGSLGITLTPDIVTIPGEISLLYTNTGSNAQLITNSIIIT